MKEKEDQVEEPIGKRDQEISAFLRAILLNRIQIVLYGILIGILLSKILLTDEV